MCWVFQQIGRNPQEFVGSTEDHITNVVVMQLKALGFAASFNVSIGGHVDVTIGYGEDYLWLAEAKRDYGAPARIWEGYLQLTSRYSTGQVGELNGGVLIYCQRERVDVVMQGWRSMLKAEVPEVVIEDSNRLQSAFTSSDFSSRTNAMLHFLHVPLPLLYEPQDKSALGSAKWGARKVK